MRVLFSTATIEVAVFFLHDALTAHLQSEGMMQQYLDVLHTIMREGVDREGRNGFTRAVWAQQMRFHLRGGEAFPAVTTKKLYFDKVVAELLWFLKGPTRDGRMDDNELCGLTGRNQSIWTANAKADYWVPKSRFPGDLGRVYGAQWRDWRGPDGSVTDQIAAAVEKLRTDPYNRRILVTAINPGEEKDMALPPCHLFFHFFVFENKVSMHMVQRSCDMFLGVPFNIASYAVLLAMMAQVANLIPWELVITLDDAHIYHEHFEAVRQQLGRTPLPLPRLWLNPQVRQIDDFTMDDIKLLDYEHLPSIQARMIV